MERSHNVFSQKRSSYMTWKDVCDTKLSEKKAKLKNKLDNALWVGKLFINGVCMHTN